MVCDPFEGIESQHKEINGRHSRQALQTKGSTELAKYGQIPIARCEETEDSVVASFELPGADKKDIDLNVTNNYIELKVGKKQEKETKKKGFYSYQISSQHFYRRIPLPAEVDSTKAQAEYKNGVLRVELPKTKRIVVSKKRIVIK
jgi:HSP20 family protein